MYCAAAAADGFALLPHLCLGVQGDSLQDIGGAPVSGSAGFKCCWRRAARRAGRKTSKICGCIFLFPGSWVIPPKGYINLWCVLVETGWQEEAPLLQGGGGQLLDETPLQLLFLPLLFFPLLFRLLLFPLLLLLLPLLPLLLAPSLLTRQVPGKHGSLQCGVGRRVLGELGGRVRLVLGLGLELGRGGF